MKNVGFPVLNGRTEKGRKGGKGGKDGKGGRAERLKGGKCGAPT